MCCTAKGRNKGILPEKKEMEILLQSTLFGEKEIHDLKRQFNQMSKNTGFLTIMQFRDSMGILGLDSVQFLSDRIFHIMADPSGKIYFQSFVSYLNTVMNGEEKDKITMSFRLIDEKNRGFFTKEDFTSMIKSIVNSWAALTQTSLILTFITLQLTIDEAKEMWAKVDMQIDHRFQVMDVRKQEKIEKEDFIEAMQKYPDLLEIFEYLNKGVTDTVAAHSEEYTRELQIIKDIQHAESLISSAYSYLSGETQDSGAAQDRLINQDQSFMRKTAGQENDIERDKLEESITLHGTNLLGPGIPRIKNLREEIEQSPLRQYQKDEDLNYSIYSNKGSDNELFAHHSTSKKKKKKSYAFKLSEKNKIESPNECKEFVQQMNTAQFLQKTQSNDEKNEINQIKNVSNEGNKDSYKGFENNKEAYEEQQEYAANMEISNNNTNITFQANHKDRSKQFSIDQDNNKNQSIQNKSTARIISAAQLNNPDQIQKPDTHFQFQNNNNNNWGQLPYSMSLQEEEIVLKKYESILCFECIQKIAKIHNDECFREKKGNILPKQSQPFGSTNGFANETNHIFQKKPNKESLEIAFKMQDCPEGMMNFHEHSENKRGSKIGQISIGNKEDIQNPIRQSMKMQLSKIAQKFLGERDDIESSYYQSEEEEQKKNMIKSHSPTSQKHYTNNQFNSDYKFSRIDQPHHHQFDSRSERNNVFPQSNQKNEEVYSPYSQIQFPLTPSGFTKQFAMNKNPTKVLAQSHKNPKDQRLTIEYNNQFYLQRNFDQQFQDAIVPEEDEEEKIDIQMKGQNIHLGADQRKQNSYLQQPSKQIYVSNYNKNCKNTEEDLLLPNSDLKIDEIHEKEINISIEDDYNIVKVKDAKEKQDPSTLNKQNEQGIDFKYENDNEFQPFLSEKLDSSVQNQLTSVLELDYVNNKRNHASKSSKQLIHFTEERGKKKSNQLDLSNSRKSELDQRKTDKDIIQPQKQEDQSPKNFLQQEELGNDGMNSRISNNHNYNLSNSLLKSIGLISVQKQPQQQQQKIQGFAMSSSKVNKNSSLSPITLAAIQGDQDKINNAYPKLMEMAIEELKRRVVTVLLTFNDLSFIMQHIRKKIDSKNGEKLLSLNNASGVSHNNINNNRRTSLNQLNHTQFGIFGQQSTSPLIPQHQSKQSGLPQQQSSGQKIDIQKQGREEVTLRNLTIHNIQKVKHKEKKEARKLKQMVFFGHQNWNLVVNMMMGIQMSVNSASSNFQLNQNVGDELQNRDFKVKYLFELLPRKENFEKSQTYKVCKFKDYAPAVFNKIRKFYNISDEQYLKSIGPNQLFSLVNGDFNSFSQLTSTGKSGSFFYYTADGQFTLKTVSSAEFHHLKIILKNYYEHLKANRNTLIIKFFGLHKIQIRMKQGMKVETVYIVIMGNVFHTTKRINERYDLKGSTYGRTTKLKTPGVTLKDLDFIESKTKLQVKFDEYEEFMNVVKKDAQFFEDNNIIDYSMLVGIHDETQPNVDQSDNVSSTVRQYFSIVGQKKDVSSLNSRNAKFIYLFGIIDILTCFNAKKKFEYLAKRIALGPTISAVPPTQYKQRFVLFMDEMFDDDSKVPPELK